MDPDLSDEQLELVHSVERFVAERASLDVTREAWEAADPFDRGRWKEMAELGLLGVLVPESQGGAGLGIVEAGLIARELAKACFPGPFVSSAIAATSAALDLDTGDWPARLAEGHAIASLAVLEPGMRAPRWASPACTAEAGRLRGEKTEVIDAAIADVFFVTTASGVFEVPADAAGVRIEPLDGIDGSRRLAAVHFEGAPGRRVGDVASLNRAVDHLLLGLSLDALGAAEAAQALAVAYAKQREQFGRPIGGFQAVAHLCVDMLQATEMGRSGALYALWAADHTDASERRRQAVMAKAYASDYYPAVGANTIQVFGGIGYAWESDAHFFYKRLLGFEQTWGNSSAWYQTLMDLV